jgi:peptidoglycan/LPS O-acetylase OafA/YrhL
MYYLFVPVLAWMMGRFGRWRVIVALYALAVLYTIVTGLLHAHTGVELWLRLQRQLPGQLGYFLAGVALYYLNDRLKGRGVALAAAAVLTFVALAVSGNPFLTTLLEPLALGILVVLAATALPYLGNFARYGDFSYGIYIIHFPVVQALVAAGAFDAHPWAAAGAALVLVTGLSALSWYAVERPFLRPRSHYRAAQNRGAAGT